MRRILRGTDLRYTLTRLLEILGHMTVSDLCFNLEQWNFAVEGRPAKVVSDALRAEVRLGRVIRLSRGLYGAGWAPRGTEYRIRSRVESLRLEAESLQVEGESLGGGHPGTLGFQRPGANPFTPELWRPVGELDPAFADLTDITYHRHVVDGVPQSTVRVAFDRPEVGNAFRPRTVDEVCRALDHARTSPDVGVVLLTGNGPSADGDWAFCSGADRHAPHPNALEVARLIRFLPKPVICLVNGSATAGGHTLHVACDLTLASREHARFIHTGDDPGAEAQCGASTRLARQVGQKFAREISLLGRTYTAEQMHDMGAVNDVVGHADLETVALQWAAEITAKSRLQPLAPLLRD